MGRVHTSVGTDDETRMRGGSSGTRPGPSDRTELTWVSVGTGDRNHPKPVIPRGRSPLFLLPSSKPLSNIDERSRRYCHLASESRNLLSLPKESQGGRGTQECVREERHTHWDHRESYRPNGEEGYCGQSNLLPELKIE